MKYVTLPRCSDGRRIVVPFRRALALARGARKAGVSLHEYLELGGYRSSKEILYN